MRRALFTAGFVLTACASPGRPAPSGSPPRTLAEHDGGVPAAADSPAVVVRLSTEPAHATPLPADAGTRDPPDAERVSVAIDLDPRALADAPIFWFRPAHDATLSDRTFRDERGGIVPRHEADGTGERFELPGRPSGRLTVRYVVTFGEKRPGTDATQPRAEPIELLTLGRDVLVLPDGDKPLPVEVHLRTAVVATAASSFGIGPDQKVSARLSDLRAALFMAGDVGTATFHAGDGDDVAGWLGFTAFDPRWVAAEMAGVRGVVDSYVGRSVSGRSPLSLLFVAMPKSVPPFVVHAGPRGFVLGVDRRAPWTARSLLLVTQALVQRYLGGFLHVGERDDPAAGSFFSAGFSRTVAREVLTEIGLLGAQDRALELNALLYASVFATDPIEVATARGALAATALDSALAIRARQANPADVAPPSSLKTFLRERLAEAANERRDTLPHAAFLRTIEDAVGPSVAARLEDTLLRGVEVDLPAQLLAPCHRLVRRTLTAFELGFTTSADAEIVVVSVVRGSRAEAAGVQPGDVVTDLRYEEGRSDVPVELTLGRRGTTTRVRFLPAGRSKPGRLFERTPGVADPRCGS